MKARPKNSTPQREGKSYVYASPIRAAEETAADYVRRFLVADTCARFRRHHGETVLLALSIEATGEAIWAGANKDDKSASKAINQYHDDVCKRLKSFGISCDWRRTVVTSSPTQRRRAQLMFLSMLKRNLIYRRDKATNGIGNPRWYFRSSGYAAQCERGLSKLSSWPPRVIQAQQATLGRVDGVELDAELLDGSGLSVFTPYPETIRDATFVSVSPTHPDIHAFVSEADIRKFHAQSSSVGVLETIQLARVPQVGKLLPVVLASSVEERFGPTALLGQPKRDKADLEIAQQLTGLPRLPISVARSNENSRRAVRYRLLDEAISQLNPWGTPIPVTLCPSCGAVPLRAEELPTEVTAASTEHGTMRRNRQMYRCTRCNAPSELDPETIDPEFLCMWMWSLVCASPEDAQYAFDSADRESAGWLPARYGVLTGDAGAALLRQRIAGRVLQDAFVAASCEENEPFTGVSVLGVCKGNESDRATNTVSQEELDNLIAQRGADVARLAILYGASPQSRINLSTASVRYVQRFLDEVRDYAGRRFRSDERSVPLEIDRSSRLRRRLLAWCGTAEKKVVASVERLEMHRAVFDTMLFFRRIQDFEHRCMLEGELTDADHTAIVVALRRLIWLLAPFAPNLANEWTAD